MKGKNFANRKLESERPSNDFYPTPSCMVKVLVESDYFPRDKNIKIFDPCCGKYAIGNVLKSFGYKNIIERDLMYNQNFLFDFYKQQKSLFPKYKFIDFKKCKNYEIETYNDDIDAIVMNPPFKEFNGFVEKAKDIVDMVYCIGKINFFGAHDRNIKGLWEHLEWVLPFDRQIAFDKPEIDGKVDCGMLVTGWFIWNKDYSGFPKIKVFDMQKHIRSKKDERNDIFKR